MDNDGNRSNRTVHPPTSCECVEFDKAVSLTGYGKFHYEAFIACAISITSVGFQNGLSAYIFPAAQCELNLSSFQLGILNVSFLVGGTLSSFFWGALADTKGRKPILISSHLLNATIIVICSVNKSVIILEICRFLNGFLVGAPGSIIFSYLAEFQPPKYRSSIICYSGLFFTSSWLLLPVLAWLVLPLDFNYELGWFLNISSWRMLFMLLALPEIIAGLWFIRLPESPKFFIARGSSKHALAVLRDMFSKNTGKKPGEFPVKNLKDAKRVRINSKFGNRGKAMRIVHGILGQFKTMFQPPMLFVTVLMSTIMFTNMFGVFGLGLWLPELFVRFERFQTLEPNRTVTVKELSLLSDIKPNSSCQFSFDPSVIRSTVAMGITSLLGNILSGLFAERVSLRTIPIVCMLIGGLSSASIYWLQSATQNLLVASIFQSSMVTANMTLGSVVVQLFPTTISAMAICLTMCAGRVGAMVSNVAFGFLMDKHCEIPIFMVAGSVLVGAGLCFKIPKKGLTIEQLENGESEKHIEIAIVSGNDTRL